MAVWFGLVTGGIEALVIEGLYLAHRCIFDFISPYIWTIPLSDAVVLAIPALISGWPMVTPGWPMRRSASSATWKPDPAATPFSATINGFVRPRIRP